MTDIATIGIMLAATHIGAAIPEGHPRTAWTPGAYIVASGVTAGVYRNSFDRVSWQLGYTHQLSGRWAISAGAVSGYPKQGQDRVLPYVALSYAFGQSVGGRVIAMPEKTGPIAVALEYRP